MAEKKKITRKVISRGATPAKDLPKKDTEVKAQSLEEGKIYKKKVCFFCSNKTSPSYTDIVALKRILSERGKIVPKLKSGLCSKHQRGVTKQVKYARHLSLLPFTPKV